jgi:hypothetical protein
MKYLIIPFYILAIPVIFTFVFLAAFLWDFNPRKAWDSAKGFLKYKTDFASQFLVVIVAVVCAGSISVLIISFLH